MTKVSPHLVLGHPLFRGIEREGPYSGALTLFVAGDTLRFDDIKAHLPTCEQVYLGAGMLSDFSWRLLTDLLTNTTLRICVEVGKKKEANDLLTLSLKYPPSRIYIILTPLMMRPDKSVHHVCKHLLDTYVKGRQLGANVGLKVDNGLSVTVMHGSRSYTNLVDASYAEDIKLPIPDRSSK